MKLLYLHHAKTPQVAMVDDEDYYWLSEWNWFAVKIKNNWYGKRNGMKLRTGHKPQQYLHRVVMRVTDPDIKIDHIDHNGLNCQKYNLRPCTKTQNDYNKRKREGTTSKYKGVSFCTDKNNWQMAIRCGKIRITKRFDKEEDAARAYDTLAKEHFGEFANLNFN